MSDKTPPTEADAGKQVPPRRHDAGSAPNETTDGLDATTESLRHAAEDIPSGALPDDLETVNGAVTDSLPTNQAATVRAAIFFLRASQTVRTSDVVSEHCSICKK